MLPFTALFIDLSFLDVHVATDNRFLLALAQWTDSQDLWMALLIMQTVSHFFPVGHPESIPWFCSVSTPSCVLKARKSQTSQGSMERLSLSSCPPGLPLSLRGHKYHFGTVSAVRVGLPWLVSAARKMRDRFRPWSSICATRQAAVRRV